LKINHLATLLWSHPIYGLHADKLRTFIMWHCLIETNLMFFEPAYALYKYVHRPKLQICRRYIKWLPATKRWPDYAKFRRLVKRFYIKLTI
jgi:hypothetical protein